MKKAYFIRLVQLAGQPNDDLEEQKAAIRREVIPLLDYLDAHTSCPNERVNLLLATLGMMIAGYSKNNKAALKDHTEIAAENLPLWVHMWSDAYVEVDEIKEHTKRGGTIQ